MSTQLELAELESSRTRLVEAEVRALRAQISPHFVYNSLTAIASFVRTDPERARDLLLEFADFTRYSFRRHGEFTTLAEELRSIDRYLLLERARFGDRLQVTVQVAPEVLPVSVPFLCIQPLVENAVRHGLEGKPGPGRVTILARDLGSEALISVEDDGIGIDPDAVRRTLAGRAGRRQRRPRQRRRATAPGVRRRVRPGRRDRPRRRDQGQHPGAEVPPRSARMSGLRVLVADDEAPAREELAWLLGQHPAVETVHTAASGGEVIEALEHLEVDALFLDIRMPGLDGLDVARALTGFAAHRRRSCS